MFHFIKIRKNIWGFLYYFKWSLFKSIMQYRYKNQVLKSLWTSEKFFDFLNLQSLHGLFKTTQVPDNHFAISGRSWNLVGIGLIAILNLNARNLQKYYNDQKFDNKINLAYLVLMSSVQNGVSHIRNTQLVSRLKHCSSTEFAATFSFLVFFQLRHKRHLSSLVHIEQHWDTCMSRSHNGVGSNPNAWK